MCYLLVQIMLPDIVSVLRISVPLALSPDICSIFENIIVNEREKRKNGFRPNRKKPAKNRIVRQANCLNGKKDPSGGPCWSGLIMV
jgi:hypothetical protein